MDSVLKAELSSATGPAPRLEISFFENSAVLTEGDSDKNRANDRELASRTEDDALSTASTKNKVRTEPKHDRTTDTSPATVSDGSELAELSMLRLSSADFVARAANCIRESEQRLRDGCRAGELVSRSDSNERNTGQRSDVALSFPSTTRNASSDKSMTEFLTKYVVNGLSVDVPLETALCIEPDESPCEQRQV